MGSRFWSRNCRRQFPDSGWRSQRARSPGVYGAQVVLPDEGERLAHLARNVIEASGETCEFALVVADELHRKGIGSALMKTLMRLARERGLKTMNGEVLQGNAPMLRLMKQLGFENHTASDDPAIVLVHRDLREDY